MQNFGKFNYMSDKAEHSLFANGKVLTRRDLTGSDASWVGVDTVMREVKVENGREANLGNSYFDKKGFELIDDNVDYLKLDFFDNQKIISSYYSHCEKVIKEFTNAQSVFAFDHNIRSASGKESKKMIKGGQQVQGPAHIVHGDYTLTSAPARLKQLSLPPGKNDTLSSILQGDESLIDPDIVTSALNGGRFAIINLWRNIVKEPVEVHPLALCDASSVSSDDLVVFEIHYSDRVGENYFAKYNNKHSWFYFSEMKHEEALLIKQWDSAGDLAKTKGLKSDSHLSDSPCTFSFHSAFEDPTTRANAPDRWSMEVRCIVIF